MRLAFNSIEFVFLIWGLSGRLISGNFCVIELLMLLHLSSSLFCDPSFRNPCWRGRRSNNGESSPEISGFCVVIDLFMLLHFSSSLFCDPSFRNPCWRCRRSNNGESSPEHPVSMLSIRLDDAPRLWRNNNRGVQR